MKRAFVAAAAILGLAATSAFASNSVSASIAVSANVPASCSLSATPIQFGQLTGAEADSSSSLSITCTPGTKLASAEFQSLNGTGTSTGFAMKGANTATTLSYSIYGDAQRTQAITNGQTYTATSGGLLAVNSGGTGTGTIYAKVAQSAAASASADTYSDTITLTVTY